MSAAGVQSKLSKVPTSPEATVPLVLDSGSSRISSRYRFGIMRMSVSMALTMKKPCLYCWIDVQRGQWKIFMMN